MLFLLIQEQGIGSGRLPPLIHINHKEVEFFQFQIRPGLTLPVCTDDQDQVRLM